MKTWISLIFFTTSLFSFPSLASTSLDAQKEALEMIADFANNICEKVPLSGESENLELSGEAKAELNGLLRKVAALGITGAAKYNTSSYQGVLQKDLVDVLKSSSKCKLEIWNDLKDKLLVSVTETNSKATLSISGTGANVRILLSNSNSTYRGGNISSVGANETIYIPRGQLLDVVITGTGARLGVDRQLLGQLSVVNRGTGARVYEI